MFAPHEFRRARVVNVATDKVMAVEERPKMPTFVSLINWTDQGVANFKDTVARSEDAKRAAAAMGGSIKEIYWTVGPYDIVTVAEFPDDSTATAFLLALGSRGNLRTTTLRAYGAEEMAQIIAKVG